MPILSPILKISLRVISGKPLKIEQVYMTSSAIRTILVLAHEISALPDVFDNRGDVHIAS